jgi:putative membrane protein
VDRRLLWFLALFAPVLAWSWINPHDRFTWWLESLPIVAGIPVMFALQRKFPLSSLLLGLIWVHGVVLVVGGHYTYAEVPLGEWAKGWFGWHRNNYDKLGHFAQGFVPAILAREIFLRASPLGGPGSESFAAASANGSVRPNRWLGFFVVSVCLAFSALYELIEWFTAVTTGEAAEAFLGTQGDPWDTQTDMLTAFIGAIVAVIGFSRLHDRSLAKLLARR